MFATEVMGVWQDGVFQSCRAASAESTSSISKMHHTINLIASRRCLLLLTRVKEVTPAIHQALRDLTHPRPTLPRPVQSSKWLKSVGVKKFGS
ncbi:hypothetical protein E2C01_012943 [Portunus trituberculatus]|uniref:Uncharacterized protein n=1 Tax=Portunus trituberculatus TaxID=210409 RepID=A0A5B7DFM5_PORTR|nr:hypothetical protein [Portunus trituberculatus]